MRVNSVTQENKQSSGVLKAGTLGAIGGAVVRNLAPLTSEEHDFFFNSSAVDAIKEKVKKVRLNEIEKIGTEFKNGSLNISKEAYDTFERVTSAVSDEPKKAYEGLKDAAPNIKDTVKSLISRVDTVGEAKRHIENGNIKNAAKSARPLFYFAAAGALLAMSGQVVANAFRSCASPKEETIKPQEHHNLTMADVVLEGLGSNTEVLFLTNHKLDK